MCLKTEEAKYSKKINRRIEAELKQSKKNSRQEVKLLLLGSGESGKSTFAKQLRIIHDHGFRESELTTNRPYVFHNIISAMQTILLAMERLDIKLDNEENNAHYVEIIKKMDILYTNLRQHFPDDYLPEQYVQAIQSLWSDAGVQQAYERRNDYKLSDSAGYFFQNVTRFGQPGFLPTTEDMLRIRVPTTGVKEHSIKIKSVWFRIVDVGGQRKEKPKWIHCFEGVTSMIFLAALNEYDMFLDPNDETSNNDDVRTNRMKDSLALFNVICSIPMLKRSSFILFLNKTDLFEDKIRTHPLSTHFPNYQGPVDDANAAREYIKQMYIEQASNFGMEGRHDSKQYHNERTDESLTGHDPMRSRTLSSRNSSSDDKKYLYTHFTSAIDTENIKFIFEAVKNTILREHLQEFFNFY